MTGLEFHDSRGPRIEAWFIDDDPVLPIATIAAYSALRSNVPVACGRLVLSADVAKRLAHEMNDLRMCLVSDPSVDGGSIYGYPIEVLK